MAENFSASQLRIIFSSSFGLFSIDFEKGFLLTNFSVEPNIGKCKNIFIQRNKVFFFFFQQTNKIPLISNNHGSHSIFGLLMKYLLPNDT